MKDTPQRLRSFAPPTRDKIFIWSAVIAGCGIIALYCCPVKKDKIIYSLQI